MGSKKKKVRPHYVAKDNRKKEPMSKNTKIAWLASFGVLFLGIILFMFLYSDGSLAVRNDVIVDKQDNWIISKLQTARTSKYFKLGEVNSSLEGFEEDPAVAIKSDANETSFTYLPADPDSQLDSYYITGVAEKAEDMVEALPAQFAAYFPESRFSDPKTVEIAGKQAHYLIATIPEEQPAEETAAEEPTTEETPSEAATEVAETEDNQASEEAPVSDQQDESTPPAEEPTTEENLEAEVNPDETQQINRTATQQLLCYIPAKRNSCILICVNLKITDEMPEWTEEQLLELLQKIGDTIIIEA